MNRRAFLQSTAVAGLALGVAPFAHPADRDRRRRVALIGAGWWGKTVLKEALASGHATAVALVDVDASALEVGAEQVADLGAGAPRTYRDHREMLRKEHPEIVIIATPDHWHALVTLDALEAGAHVYLEKPTGHTIAESQAIVRAARDAGRVIQVGLHRRVGPHHVSAMKFLRSGAVGDVGMVRAFADSSGGSERAAPNDDPPEGLDWNAWCGPGPLRPFNKRIHPGGWRHFLDYANGTLGDWGVHWLDQVLWWSNEPYPRRVFSTGGRLAGSPVVLNAKEQTTDAPDHQVAVYEFEKFTCVWEHRRFAGNASEHHGIGVYFYGTKGVLHVGWRDGWTFYPSSPGGQKVHEDSRLQEPDGHNIRLLWADFVRAIETGEAPAAGIEVGHRSSVLALLGMLSLRLGRSLNWDGAREAVVGDEEANRLLRRTYRAPWVYPA